MQSTKSPPRKRRRALLLATLKRCVLPSAVLLLCAFFFWHQAPAKEPIEWQEPKIRKALIIINRHGARSALQHYTFENVTWDVPLGQLSIQGMHQAFKLGTHLKAQYFNPTTSLQRRLLDFKIFSTYFDRTIETARAVVLGFVYGSTDVLVDELSSDGCRLPHTPASYACLQECLGIPKEMRWNGSLPNVRVTQKDDKEVGMMQQYERCKGFPQEIAKLHDRMDLSSEIESRFARQFALVRQIVGGEEVCMDRVARLTNEKEQLQQECREIDLQVVENIWDNFVTMFHAGKRFLPFDGNASEVLSFLEEAVTWKWHQEFSKENGQLAGGMLVNEIISQIDGVLRKTKSRWSIRKFSPSPFDDDEFLQTVIFSSHDKTIASLMSALGAKEWHIPRYVSYVSFLVTGPPGGAYFDKQDLEIRYDGRLLGSEACKGGRCSLKAFYNNTRDLQVPTGSCELVDPVDM